ncbi:MAG: bifunctional DNA-formamidopyrimidine glycosylase/DNA-(apurinic or apyrimidinic site) lyase [Robiginitomaculum sp.]
MPELPEVQTVLGGLAPVMEGYCFERVTLNRKDLRFAFAPRFKARLEGARIDAMTRRAKFLMLSLSTGETLLMHLGMSGRFTVNPEGGREKHDHVVFKMSSGATVVYNDARRFGFMELFEAGPITRLDHLGPEPLSNHFNGPALRAALKAKKSPIKTALLDQRVVAGLGNIYVCEALYRARINPRKLSGRLSAEQCGTLAAHIKDILTEAIKAGGSTLKDFVSADGELGYFQHSFDVYGREGKPCRTCETPLTRISQSGRSTFYCAACQMD